MTTSGRGGASLKPTSRFAGFAFIAFQQDGLRWPAFQESDTMKDDIISCPFNGLTSSSIIVGLRGKKKKKKGKSDGCEFQEGLLQVETTMKP